MFDEHGRKSNANHAATKAKPSTSRPSRRSVLKAGAALAGAAAGSDVLRGFPTIWAQEIKDIELRHVGVSYSVVKAIGDQASKDLGFKVTMQNLDTSAAINRFITQPNTVDIADLEGWQAKLAAARGASRVSRAEINEFDNILPIFTKGEIDGQQVSRQGISPYEAMYIARTPPSCMTASPIGRPSCRRSTTPTPSATGPTLSTCGHAVEGADRPHSRARPRSSTCRPSASWTPPSASRAPA